TRLGIRIENRKIKLLFLGIEINKEVVNLVENFLRTRVGPVDFINDENRLQIRFESFAQHVTRLRQRAFAGIDQQHDAIDHLERPLHFAAKIGVPGRIHDVDFYSRIKHSRVLGKNGDAALAFQIVRVHDALGHSLVVAKRPALPEHGVHQRGLAVIHVGNDSDVANTRIQIENSSGLQIRAYYYFTMARSFAAVDRGDRVVTGLRPVPAGQSPATTRPSTDRRRRGAFLPTFIAAAAQIR